MHGYGIWKFYFIFFLFRCLHFTKRSVCKIIIKHLSNLSTNSFGHFLPIFILLWTELFSCQLFIYFTCFHFWLTRNTKLEINKKMLKKIIISKTHTLLLNSMCINNIHCLRPFLNWIHVFVIKIFVVVAVSFQCMTVYE